MVRGLNHAKKILIGWLSALMRIPFSFERIDPTFRQAVVNHCKENMFSGGILQQMATFCFARYLGNLLT